MVGTPGWEVVMMKAKGLWLTRTRSSTTGMLVVYENTSALTSGPQRRTSIVSFVGTTRAWESADQVWLRVVEVST